MLGPLTQILVFGARSGVWTTWEALRCGHIARPHQGCLNPVPQSRSGKRELGNMRVAAWQTQGKEVGIRPYAEHLPRPSPSLFPVLFSSSFFLSCLPLLFAPRPPPSAVFLCSSALSRLGGLFCVLLVSFFFWGGGGGGSVYGSVTVAPLVLRTPACPGLPATARHVARTGLEARTPGLGVRRREKKIEGERRDVHNPGTGRRCGVDWQCEAPERLYGGEARRAGA